MKAKYIIILVIIVAAAAFYSRILYHKSQLKMSSGVGAAGGQSDRNGNGEGAIPQSGDLCGDTGGNGQIVSMGNNTIIMKRKDDGRSQIIHFTDQETIKTSADSGSTSESNLKTGDRVTLVGGTNPDGSFTANTILVCK